MWPTDDWPEGPMPPGVEVDDLLEEMWSLGQHGTTYATVIIHDGRLVHERYGNELVHWDRPNEPVTRDTPLLSWSMAKSMMHAVVGMLVGDGRMALAQPASDSIGSWRSDLRAAITLDHLLCMRDGLDWAEDYVDAGVSNVIEMLFGEGQHDVAAYAESRPLAAMPGERFNYSSGTSYLYAPAREMARFGYLYLRGGVWGGTRLLPEGWVDHARLIRSTDPTDGRFHGAHWWCTGDDHGTYWASGYEGQSITISPALDLVVVRLGHSPEPLGAGLHDWRARVVDRFARR